MDVGLVQQLGQTVDMFACLHAGRGAPRRGLVAAVHAVDGVVRAVSARRGDGLRLCPVG